MHLNFGEGEAMKCDFDYCIYNRDFICILEEISINSLGMCEECIMIELDEGFLEAEKECQYRSRLP